MELKESSDTQNLFNRFCVLEIVKFGVIDFMCYFVCNKSSIDLFE